MQKIIILFVFSFLLSNCTSTYYLVRHAERLDNSKDSPLSEAGNQRAFALKERLENKGIDVVYATKYKRTQQTAQPTADAIQNEYIIYSTDQTYEFVESLKKMKNKDILVVGHSNTVPEMVLYFTADTVFIGHNDYDDLFIVEMKSGLFGKNTTLEKSTYGN